MTKTVSIDVDLLTRVQDYAEENNLSFSATTTKLLRLGFVRLHEMQDEARIEIERDARAKVLAEGNK